MMVAVELRLKISYPIIHGHHKKDISPRLGGVLAVSQAIDNNSDTRP